MRNVVLRRVNKDWLILIKSGKAKLVNHMLRRNCFVEHVIEGNVEGRIDVKVRRERRRKQLPDKLKEREDTRD